MQVVSAAVLVIEGLLGREVGKNKMEDALSSIKQPSPVRPSILQKTGASHTTILMKKKYLELGPGLQLPLDAVTMTFGILAIRGAGKSNLAAVMAEEMFAAHLPFVVVDPVGSWWGLRSSAGGAPGLPIAIFGGRHGDVPLDRSGGNLIADLVTEKRLSCVLDLSEFGSEGDKKTFLLDFARRLYRKNEQPLHLFLEEADDYIPQRPMRDEAQLLRAWENIVRRGRARGLGITLITQRSAVLNKNVLTQVENLFVLRTTGPQDRAAIEAWVKYHAQSQELLESLPGLETGEAWFWSPHWLRVMKRVQVRRRATFDSGATPKGAKAGTKPTNLADVDLSAIQKEMADAIKKAADEDPRELRRRLAEADRKIAALEKKLREQPVPEPIRIEVPILANGQLQELNSAVQTIVTVSDGLKSAIAQATARRPSPPPIKGVQPTHKAPRPAAKPSTDGDGSLTGPEQRILDALAWLESIGVDDAEQTAVAFLAGYSPRGGAYQNPRGRLRTQGLIDYRSGKLVLTEAGGSRANRPDAPLITEHLHGRVLERLPGPERKLLSALLEVYPQALSYEELAQRTGYSAGGGAFGNPRSRLRSLGLITYPERGRVRAADLLFLDAVPSA
jgi:hypothetical protein